MKINSVHSGAFNSNFVFATLSLLLVATLTLSPIASAATPEPNYGTATVDGDEVEWDTVFPSDDFFADMLRAGGLGPGDTLGHLFLRYDISTNTLYVLVLTADRTRSMIIEDDLGEETFVKIDDSKVVSSASGSSNFAWVDANSTHAVGFEASFTLMPGTYNLYVHTLYDDGEVDKDGNPKAETSATLRTGIPLTVVPEPAAIIAFASIAAAAGLFAVYKRRKTKA